MRRSVLLLLIAAFFCVSIASAAVEQIQILDTGKHMPSGMFALMAAIMVVTLIVSYRYNDEMAGIISTGSAFVVMWTSRGIDYVTGLSANATTTTVVHTIYQVDIVSMFAIICLVLSGLNLYRIWVLSKKEGTTTLQQGGQQQGIQK